MAGSLSVARTWGTVEAERRMPFPCDRHLADPEDACYRGVDVEAPAGTVFRWLCQLKAAPYSYDWLDNFGRQSPRELTPGLEELSEGQRVMGIFDLVEFERDRHLTLRLKRLRWVFGDVALTYMVLPRGREGSRIVVKLLVRYPSGRVRGLAGPRVMPWVDLVMMRKQLLTLKELAESQAGTTGP